VRHSNGAALGLWTLIPGDGNRYEVIDGELLVSPAPSWTHQRAVSELHVLLREYANANAVRTSGSPIKCSAWFSL